MLEVPPTLLLVEADPRMLNHILVNLLGNAAKFTPPVWDRGPMLPAGDGAEVKLTRKEYALLAELARFPGRVTTHAHLLRAVWGEGHLLDVEYLRVAMRALRLKLETNPAAPRLLVNDPWVGYRLIAG